MAYTFKTRAFGPNAKGNTLSFEELDEKEYLPGVINKEILLLDEGDKLFAST